MSDVEIGKTRHKRSKEKSNRKERKDVIVPSKSGESVDADAEEIRNQNNVNDGVDKNTIGKIDVHTLNYFKRVEKLLSDDTFEDAESKGLFLNNVLAQVGVGMRTCQLARHRLTSKVLENLIEICNAKQFSELLESLMEDVLAISRDRFGSHVLQKAVCMMLKHLKHSDEVVSMKTIGLFFQFLTEMKKNLPTLIRDTYASHILSSLIQVLAGIQIPDNVTRSRNSQASKGKQVRGDMQKKTGPISFGIFVEKVNYPIPDTFQKKLHKFAKRILKDFNFGELLCHKNASIVIQILLLALKECEVRSCERLCNMILEKSKVFQQSSEMETDDTNKRVPILFADEVGSHVMEKIFYVASNDLYELIFSNCFKKNLLKFSLHPLANFILQHMLRNIPLSEIASAALEELIPYTEDILASGNMGVVIRMAELAQRFDCKQKDFLSALSKAFHLPPGKEERNSLIKLLLTLSTYDVMFERKSVNETEGSALENNADASNEVSTGKLTSDTMNYHGSCLSKVLFHFKDPKILAKSLLSLNDELFFLMQHEYGSFVVEEFIASKSVSKSHKTKFLLAIKDNIVAIAKDKYGSHVIDKLWENGTDDEKKIIRAELFKFRGQLKGNMYGRIILRNCGLESFQLPHAVAGKDDSSRTEGFKADEERRVSVMKKKRKGNDLHMKETEDNIKNKKARNNFGSSYNDELLKLGVGICSNEDELKDPKDRLKKHVGKESSREIDELFAKGSKKKKGQAS